MQTKDKNLVAYLMVHGVEFRRVKKTVFEADIPQSDDLVASFLDATGYNVNIFQFLSKLAEVEKMEMYKEPAPEKEAPMTNNEKAKL